MHNWGDDSFDWKGLNEASEFIRGEFKKYRISVRQIKEKFGSLRCYCSLGWNSLLSITHPGYGWYPYPKWLRYLDIYFLSKIICKLNWIIVSFHKKVYRNTYKRAVEMYPHLKEEICCAADYRDLLDFYNKED